MWIRKIRTTLGSQGHGGIASIITVKMPKNDVGFTEERLPLDTQTKRRDREQKPPSTIVHQGHPTHKGRGGEIEKRPRSGEPKPRKRNAPHTEGAARVVHFEARASLISQLT
ncbi:hypothetical protein ECG_04568 [Echinococcus granulosus]|nr:hypothetical protein ECG_04568 [Echinococcus granulosus]